MWVCNAAGLGRDASAAASGPVSPVFLQGIGHVVPLQSTRSGTLNGEHPATCWTPWGLVFLNCLSGQNCPESNRIAEVGLVGPAHSWRLMLELLTFEGFVSGLVSPRQTLLLLPSDHWPGRMG